jgi:hypothetical protein
MCVQTAELHVEQPNDVDTAMAINKLKNGEATEHDKFPAELIKEGSKGLKKVIFEPISKIWEEDIIPHVWKFGMISPIDKKRDDNYVR